MSSSPSQWQAIANFRTSTLRLEVHCHLCHPLSSVGLLSFACGLTRRQAAGSSHEFWPTIKALSLSRVRSCVRMCSVMKSVINELGTSGYMAWKQNVRGCCPHSITRQPCTMVHRVAMWPESRKSCSVGIQTALEVLCMLTGRLVDSL